MAGELALFHHHSTRGLVLEVELFFSLYGCHGFLLHSLSTHSNQNLGTDLERSLANNKGDTASFKD